MSTTARRLIRYLSPYRTYFWVAFVFLLVATAADVFAVPLAAKYIDEMVSPRNFDPTWIVIYGGLFLGLHILSSILHYYQLVRFHTLAQWIVRQIRTDVFARVQHLGLSFYDKKPTGSLVSRITNDTEAVKDLYVEVLASFMQNAIYVIGVFAALFALNWRLALVTTFILPIFWWLMKMYQKYSSVSFRKSREKLSAMNAKLSESLGGMNIIQAFTQEKRLREEFGKLNDEHFKANLRNVQLFGLLLRPASRVVYALALVVVLYYFGILSFDGAVTIGEMFAFINLFERVFEPFNQMMMRLAPMQQSIVSAERVFELMDDTETAPAKQGEGNPEITAGEIEFRNVTFSYDGETDVLKNISFKAKPGQTVALVGHTGSGKSSTIQLLMRFYPLVQGTILLDGEPLETFSDEELRSKMGLVLQDSFMFYGDVKSNIRLHNQAITDEQVREAAEFVQANTFIEKLPKGYDEPIGERGATFSSGQRQLLSFARTMAIDPKILVLDEATASVDTETEEAIQVALNKMRKGRTTIAIAHRLSTIQDADLILVLHRGEIVERGTHQELLAEEGLYHKMYLLQQGATSLVAN
ncbi:ATP-binding cassette subfamily B protein [Croceifilum oryzae]|uniref:ATP-binding cassette subfamily B protein n=1 Tax=Croceifilum oryzae TaxID=1553429 RepID=A0AAJ1TJX8_9BACL|nr:ABC transporter ATP-binding protein [Croceifilum oryzae]MDQ0417486.1 ATP-binding cassette subfamily B protein [Croceifilum oryzae]